MEKKIYQTPETESIHMELNGHLLGVSIEKGEGPGTGTIEIESKYNDWDEWDCAENFNDL